MFDSVKSYEYPTLYSFSKEDGDMVQKHNTTQRKSALTSMLNLKRIYSVMLSPDITHKIKDTQNFSM